jgi:phosphoribosylformylglycinamidine synthase
MSYKTAVIVFPGSNCDRDIEYALKTHYNHSVDMIWHKNSITEKYDLVVVPGGFSYGDYLRSGAIARFSNAMKSLDSHIKRGARVLGICNGFQILTEAKLLPGCLMRNISLKHICKTVSIKRGSISNPLTEKIANSVLNIPISHGEGCYFAEADIIKQLEDENRILIKYSGENPNGSLDDIAGITSADFKIAGLMPHPERALEKWSGSQDGKIFFDSFFLI